MATATPFKETSSTNYLYDGLNLIAELDGDNNDAVIAWYVYAGLDRPLVRIAADGTRLYYHQDILGSVVALTNDSGAVTTRYNYSPFGETEVTHLIGTEINQPFRFTGKYFDEETGFTYFPYRYYSHEIRRFISEDPLRFAAGDVNFYAYVGNNPVNFTDPLGLWSFSVDFYYLVGGGITFGTNPDGTNFISGRIGIGIGGGFGYDHEGESPLYEEECQNQPFQVGIGFAGNVGLSAGPLDISYGQHTGVKSTNDLQLSVYDKAGSDFGLNEELYNWLKLGVGGNLSLEITEDTRY